MKVLKLVLGGESGTGKTSFIKKSLKNAFSQLEQPTVDAEIYSQTKTIGDDEITLQLWDLSGSPQYRFLQDEHIMGIVGAIVFFTDRPTFAKIPEWVAYLRMKSGQPNIPVILVRSKSDLGGEGPSEDEIETMISQYYLNGFIEISSKTGENTGRALDLITHAVLKLPLPEIIEEIPPIEEVIEVVEEVISDEGFAEEVVEVSPLEGIIEEIDEVITPEEVISPPDQVTEEVKVTIEERPEEIQRIQPEISSESEASEEERFDLATFLRETRKGVLAMILLDLEKAEEHFAKARKETNKLIEKIFPKK